MKMISWQNFFIFRVIPKNPLILERRVRSDYFAFYKKQTFQL